MFKYLYITVLTAFFMNIIPGNLFSQDMFNKLTGMYEKKEFFKMYELSKNSGLEGWQRSYINAVSTSLFSRPGESNSLIDDLISIHSGSMTDSLLLNLYEIRLHNMVNLGKYKEAMEITDLVLSKYSSLIDSTEKDEMENSAVIWKAAMDVPPQSVEFKDNTTVSAKRDMAGLMNIPLSLNGVDADFVFDTGANFSVITRSYAIKHKVKILDGKIKVGGMTGNKMDSELGVAETLQIGNMVFHNVILLVMPDEVLSFAGGLYKINGIIGFPVIREMREIHFKGEEIFVPKTASKKDFKNLVLNGFMPVINVINGNDSLAFSFDTGAKKTILFTPYYEKYKGSIDSKYEPEEIEVGGAGESKKVQGFIIDKIILKIADSKAEINEVRLAKEKLLDDSKYFYGNLGQDFFNQFDEMILNFESMYVEFKNKK
jgi:predicted aspartyl protease